MSGVIINPFIFGSGDSGGDITVINKAESSLSVSNRGTHEYSYMLTSTETNDTLALLIVFIGDHGDVTVTPDVGTKIVETTHNDAGKVWIGYYEPDATDITAGQVDFAYETDFLEVMQYVIYEVSGLDLSNGATSLVSETVYDGSNADRTSVGPMEVTASAGGLILSAAATSGADFAANISVQTANSFTTDFENESTDEGDANWMVASRTVESAGDYNSPVFALDTSVEINGLTVAFNPA